MVDEVMKFITEADPEVGEAIEAEAALIELTSKNPKRRITS